MLGRVIASSLMTMASPSSMGDNTSPHNLTLQAVTPAPLPKIFKSKLRHIECSSIPGADSLFRRSHLRWIVVGEVHGTNEAPQIFADLACLAASSEPVVVAVEKAAVEQPAIDEFIASDGSSQAVKRFSASKMWNEPLPDGRSSQSYFRLFQRLRELRAAGRVKSVIAFQPNFSFRPGEYSAAKYENALASSLISRVPQGLRALVLVGSSHAQSTSPSWAKSPYLPMVGYLPADRTVTLEARSAGGSAWNCAGDDCGAHAVGSTGEGPKRSIVMDAPGGLYAGALNLGVRLTASPPQVSAALRVSP